MGNRNLIITIEREYWKRRPELWAGSWLRIWESIFTTMKF
mgnify:CR=1 FL=1